MRGRLAALGGATTLLLLLLFLSGPSTFELVYGDSRPSVPGHHPYTKPDSQAWNPPRPKEISDEPPIERLVVKVALENEDTAWLDSLFPFWRKEVLTIAPTFSRLHPSGRVDRGRVASAYLAWIIENYAALPDTTVFLQPAGSAHAAKRSLHQVLFWKPGSPSANMVADLQALQIPWVQQTGFAHLRCRSAASCVHPFAALSHAFRTRDAWADLFGKNASVPANLAAPLNGAEFAVSKAQVRKRGLHEYLRFWTWLNETDMDDDSAGLVLETVWHVVFGREPEGCMDEGVCGCEVFGRCEGMRSEGVVWEV